MKKRLVIITDCADVAYSEIRGTVLSQLEYPDSVEIEPLVEVVPFSLINGSFLLRIITDAYPDGTIFSVILNPLREITERIVVKTKKRKFVIFTTNTGVLGWVAKEYGIEECYELINPGFKPFGGKYIHAPAVGKFLNGSELKSLGTIFDEKNIRDITFAEGSILHIDNFGLVKIFYDPCKLTLGETYVVFSDKVSMEVKFVERLMSQTDGTWALYPGSSLGFLELGCARVNKTPGLGVEVGDILSISKK